MVLFWCYLQLWDNYCLSLKMGLILKFGRRELTLEKGGKALLLLALSSAVLDNIGEDSI